MLTGSSPNAIEFINVSKRFQLAEGRTLREFVPALVWGNGFAPPFYALSEVTFSVARGESLGIIERNGSGKSTLLKLIAGVMVPTRGRVEVRGRVSPLIELGAGFHPDLTGRENVYLNACILGLTVRQVAQKFDEIVSFAELEDFIDTPVKRYSSGMYMRLGFAVAVHCDPDILLVDEVLSVGDASFQEKCMDKMREFQAQGVTIVFVSHTLDQIREFCDRALWLKNGTVVAEDTPDEVIRHYKEAMTHHSPELV